MTNPMTISQILAAASVMSVTEQLIINKGLCEIIRRGRTVAKITSGAAFVPGMIVCFDAKRKGIKTIKIEKFNRAGTAVVGFECNAQGEKLPGSNRWTVANTLCSKVA